MYILPLSPMACVKSYKSNLNNNNNVTLVNDKCDTLTFTSYNSVLEDFAKTKLNRESVVDKHFSKLMTSVWTDSKIKLEDSFSKLTDVYSKKGLYGTLRELWLPNSSKEVSDILKTSDSEVITLGRLVDNNESESVIELVNFGRHGFFNNLFDKQNSPRDIRLVFSNTNRTQTENPNRFSVELFLDKKGDLNIDRQYGSNNNFIGFHSLTGHRKVEINHYGECKPEVTYYNKDGSKSFLKNFLYGGVQTEPIY